MSPGFPDYPVYKNTEITINQAVRIFKGAVNIPEEKVCNWIPNICPSRNATFAVSLSSISAKDLPCDGHGRWVPQGTTSQYFDEIGTRKDSYRRKPDDFSLQDCQTSYQNADAPDFRNKVFLGLDSNGNAIGQLALIAYHWNCEPYQFIPSPHGNACKQSAKVSYQRTKPSVLEEMRGLTSSLAPRQVVQQVSQSHGGVSEAVALADLPRDRMQAYNVAKQDPNSRRLSGTGKKRSTDFDVVHHS